MRFSLFSKLAADSALLQAQAFSQQVWRKQHYSLDPGTLCSGLTYFWLTEKMCCRSPMSQIEEPNAELLHRISRLQALSYYPVFPQNFNPGERDLILLNRKYGTRDWREVRQRVIDEHQGDYVLYDLSQMFRYDSASIARFAHLPQVFPCREPLPPSSAVLGVLRYRQRGQPSGHRIAYYLDRDKRHHFFDSNAGEVVESRDPNFHHWLNAFFLHANYRKLRYSVEDSFLTLYKLRNVSSQNQSMLPLTDH